MESCLHNYTIGALTCFQNGYLGSIEFPETPLERRDPYTAHHSQWLYIRYSDPKKNDDIVAPVAPDPLRRIGCFIVDLIVSLIKSSFTPPTPPIPPTPPTIKYMSFRDFAIVGYDKADRDGFSTSSYQYERCERSRLFSYDERVTWDNRTVYYFAWMEQHGFNNSSPCNRYIYRNPAYFMNYYSLRPRVEFVNPIYILSAGLYYGDRVYSLSVDKHNSYRDTRYASIYCAIQQYNKDVFFTHIKYSRQFMEIFVKFFNHYDTI